MPHVLVVDDDEQSQSSLAEVVVGHGFTVATAGSLFAARRQIAIRQPDVILLDLILPDGNGMELFEQLESGTHTEMILITGYATLESSIEALRLGAVDYLTKPINLTLKKQRISGFDSMC
jgi:DNA-binding NtrC family response regulator